MNIRDLSYLIALDEHKHFGRAAEASFVSQPTLSMQIKKLEEQLGVQLIEREPRNIVFTEAGKAILSRARVIMQEIQAIKEDAKLSASPDKGTIKLGLFPTIAPYLLAHIIPSVKTLFPDLTLLLTEEKSGLLVEKLMEGKLDAAILALPLTEAQKQQLDTEFLFTEPFMLATSANHPLAQYDSITLEQLSKHDLLLLDEGHCLRAQALEVCYLAGNQEQIGFQATSLETLRQMVIMNVGITLFPMLAIIPPITTPATIKFIPFKDSIPKREIAIVWRKRSSLSPFLSKFAKAFETINPLILEFESTFFRDHQQD
ncbi:LysR substrate-binding domain-containing protein [Thorsellia anophelis]|uniref:LysR family transcriptional regulator, hydrogen peroxide-inducible genes activator n=1 Tax=Thorsellia anophelis DSM 18579 TaxID=1123402 RepID=A0A1H9ZS54_9GAMM|nr:LysR substrate-binding domain-containing protein [Thorsellia anophelis]SES84598.1 LysR family transcriptional regulator, hydrogen peroxide-inducible genes activator [Thorsellia anophelis DSM 18579]